MQIVILMLQKWSFTQFLRWFLPFGKLKICIFDNFSLSLPSIRIKVSYETKSIKFIKSSPKTCGCP